MAAGLVGAVAAVHVLRVGSHLTGDLHDAYYGWFSDVAIPFAGYFLLSIAERGTPLLRDWRVKAGLVFTAAASAEILQGLGVPLLGRTFDPLDFAMFAIGTGLAVAVDRSVLGR